MSAGGTTDDERFEQWYRTEHPRLVGALTVIAGDVHVAHEAVSEAFARAYERLPHVAGMDSPTGWVRVVAVNVLRRQQRRAALERRLLRRVPDASRTAPPPTVEPEVWEAVRSLPHRQRAVLALRVVLDLPQAEVAALLGIRPGTVAATLHAARHNLARQLGEPEPELDLTEPDHA